MFDLNQKSKKIATKIGASVTILVLFAACSSKQVINESSVPEPIEYTDTVTDENLYVDKSEFPAFQPEERPVVKKKKNRVAHTKSKRVARAEKPKAQPIEPSFDDNTALAAMGSVQDTNPPMPPPPPPPSEELIQSNTPFDQPVLESEGSADLSALIIENWYYIVGFLVLGLGLIFGFKVYQKRFPGKRKKTRLVFN